MKFPRILSAFAGTPWALEESRYFALRDYLYSVARGEAPAPAPLAADLQRRPGGYAVAGRVAVIPVMGVIMQRASMMDAECGAVSTEDLRKQIAAAVSDKSVGRIVLQIDSPGGSVFGMQELAADIQQLGTQKKIIAVADSVAASAAYWILASASEAYVTPGGQVGSIGVIMEHVDQSKAEEAAGFKTTVIRSSPFKQETHPSSPLSAEAAGELQKMVNHYHEAFVAGVARGRGVSASVVESKFGAGRMMTAGDAKAAGMVDGVATFDKVLARLGVETAATAAKSSAAAMARARAVEIS